MLSPLAAATGARLKRGLAFGGCFAVYPTEMFLSRGYPLPASDYQVLSPLAAVTDMSDYRVLSP